MTLRLVSLDVVNLLVQLSIVGEDPFTCICFNSLSHQLTMANQSFRSQTRGINLNAICTSQGTGLRGPRIDNAFSKRRIT